MRKVKLIASMEAKISNENFGNNTVFFSMHEDLEGEFSDTELLEKQKNMFKTFCADPIAVKESELLIRAIQKEFQYLRVLKCPKCEKSHPSITTVRDFDNKGFYCSDEQLEIAIADGTIQDLRCRHFVATGEWLPAEKIPYCKPHLEVLRGKKTDYNNFDFVAFLKEWPIKNMVSPEREFDCENEVTYESDLVGVTVGWDIGTKKEPKVIQDLETVFDYKRNVDKDSAFFQMSIAAKNKGLKRMVAIPVNGQTKQGYSDPVISNDVEGYFEIFKEKRRKFRKRFGI